MYNIVLKKSAEKELDKVSEPYRTKIANAIQLLAVNPRPEGFKQLKGESAFRIRVADYRIIYTVEEVIKIIEVVRIRHRKDVYKR